jgi:hypothetical protein
VTNGGAVPLAGYVVPISLDTRALVAARKVRSDCADLSAYDTDLSTPLPYWVSVGECNGPTTLVFTKVSAIPAGGETHFYLVFGNGRPHVPPDPVRVFAFFDDFDGTSLDETKWTHFGDGTYEVANGLLTTQHTKGTGMAVAGGARYCAGKAASPMPVFDGEWRDVEFRYDIHDGYVTHTVERLDGFTSTQRLATSPTCMPPERGRYCSRSTTPRVWAWTLSPMSTGSTSATWQTPSPRRPTSSLLGRYSDAEIRSRDRPRRSLPA